MDQNCVETKRIIQTLGMTCQQAIIEIEAGRDSARINLKLSPEYKSGKRDGIMTNGVKISFSAGDPKGVAIQSQINYLNRSADIPISTSIKKLITIIAAFDICETTIDLSFLTGIIT